MFVLQRLNAEGSEKIYEIEDVLEAFDGLHKAARSDFTRNFLTFKRYIRSDFDFHLGLQNHGRPPEGAEGALREPSGRIEVKSGPSPK